MRERVPTSFQRSAVVAALLLAIGLGLAVQALPLPRLHGGPGSIWVAEATDAGVGLGASGKGSEREDPAAAPGFPASLWNDLMDTPLGHRVREITGWIGSFFRFLWTIPQALIKGDSQSMIEALGELLSRATPPGEAAATPPAMLPEQRPQPLMQRSRAGRDSSGS